MIGQDIKDYASIIWLNQDCKSGQYWIKILQLEFYSSIYFFLFINWIVFTGMHECLC